MATPVLRRAARALVIDDTGRLLLFHGDVPEGVGWFAPGGALEADETYEQALVRELFEETGIDVSVEALRAPVWWRRFVFTWNGIDELHDERFFLVRAPTAREDRGAVRIDSEKGRDHRWWTVDEIERSSDMFSPARMATLLRPLLRGELPPAPVHADG